MHLGRREFISTSLTAAAAIAQQASPASGQGKETRYLKDGWEVHPLEGHGKLSEAQVSELGQRTASTYRDWLETAVPAEVQEVLLSHRRIEDPRVPGGPRLGLPRFVCCATNEPAILPVF
jgi:hypothetical protein